MRNLKKGKTAVKNKVIGVMIKGGGDSLVDWIMEAV